MRVCLFEDQPQSLEPLTLTRPVFDLRCGIATLSAKIWRHFQATARGALVRPAVADIFASEQANVACNDNWWLGNQPTLLVNGRWLPPATKTTLPEGSCVGLVDGELAYVKLSAEQLRFVTLPQLADCLDHWTRTLPPQNAGGALVRYPWQLVEANGRQIIEDFAAYAPAPSAVGSHVGLVGPRDQLWIHPSARVDPMVVADTTSGPVVIDQDAVIHPFTRLEGPCYVGPGAQILGAKIRAGTTIGPCCRIGGEVEASILQGYVNKYHEGFLGHSYVGAWVNLAAGTHTSDLRCDYGEVTMTVQGSPVPTGLRKIGALIGDHTRTGLGVLLNTGTTIGACCLLLQGGGFAPRRVPSFTRWANGRLEEMKGVAEQAETTRIVMERRGQALTRLQRDLLEAIWNDTASERKASLRQAELQRLRRSA
ncbi:MAG: putative sugar nucleotidyl transferase [Gemmataceae bacterium]